MKAPRRFVRLRSGALALAGGMLILLVGDRAHLAPPTGVGIDPLEVLDLQIKNNVAIVLDTSGSMKWPLDKNNFTLGGDDPASRMYQAKQAIAAVVAANQSRLNIGLISYNVTNTQKTINRGQDFEQDGRADGPFVYVTADGPQVANFYNGPCAANNTGSGTDAFFCDINATFLNYNDLTSLEVYRSFMNRGGTNQPVAYNEPYPVGCTPNAGVLSPVTPANPGAMRCRYYMQSRLIRNNVRFTWNRGLGSAGMVAAAPIPGGCPAPPAGLVAHANPPCFQLQDGNGGPVATFYYSSAIYQMTGSAFCGGGALIAPVAPCGSNNAPAVISKMDLELPLADLPPAPGIGSFDYGDGHLDGDQTADRGLRADQSTPLAATLNFIRTAGTPVFPPAVDPQQRNFVILVTDGDDTCADSSDLDRSAVLAAEEAEQLYINGTFQRQAETLVVGFASAVTTARLDVIGQGGSGAIINGGASTPGTAVTGCRAGAACRNAFFASDTQQLIDLLNSALDRVVTTGFFSATASVNDSIPEFVRRVAVPPTPPPSPSPAPSPSPTPPPDPMDPFSRYKAESFVSYRASFDVAGFRGLVEAFDFCGLIRGGARPANCPTYPYYPFPAPAGNSPKPNWEAGQELLNRISPDLVRTGAVNNTLDHSFEDLLGPASGSIPVGSPGTHVHRRIFTTSRNGRDLSAARVNLWPPDSAVILPSRTDYSSPGSLDNALFLKPDGTQMTLADLQAAPLRACMGSNLPAACTNTNAAVRLAAAKKEAREMIIAYAAGVEPLLDGSSNPTRFSDSAPAARRRHIVYRRRPWVLAESTYGQPAIMGPPLEEPPGVHTQDYLLFLDGPRATNGDAPGNTDFFIRQGFGLRHPDRDGRGVSRPLLKPVMSVLFVPSNDGLHAFRAAPCPSVAGGLTAIPGAPCAAGSPVETGGEELWTFIPHDQLPKLKDRMAVQTRTNKTYMLASSVRFADVYVPLSSPVTFTFGGRTYTINGRWRRLLFVGRGIGGKHYSALDVTQIGPFTAAALQTELPTVLWNRGNPDTQDGLPGGGANGSGGDMMLYADMGQTWATPAVSRVPPAANNGLDYVLHVGSGYPGLGGAPNEGTRFYTLDPMTGDIVASADVGDGGQGGFPNALVANPVSYAPRVVTKPAQGENFPHPAGEVAEAIYVGDIHGRLWKFDTSDPGTPLLFRDLGPNQPIGSAGALLKLPRENGARVFVQSGYDARVNAPAGGFKMFGFRDDGPPYPGGSSPPDFTLDFPPPTGGKGDYRGTLQPVTAFSFSDTNDDGRVFFVGTRFNPPGVSCRSGFDTVIFGLNAASGGPAYSTQEYFDVKALGTPRAPVPPPPGGQPPVDQGTAPPGGRPQTVLPPPPAAAPPPTLTVLRLHSGTTICRDR